MSHDEVGGTVTRKERRKARNGKRQAAPRYIFKAADYVRVDWGPAMLIEFLEERAHGYNGILRSILCTAAEMMRAQEKSLGGYRDQAISEAVAAEEAAPVVSKRNQQPGRLSGSERAALKNFAELVYEAGDREDLKAEAMTAGRKMLAKVRKRALGGEAEEVSDEDLDDPKLIGFDPEAQEDPPEVLPNPFRQVLGEVGA